MGACRWYDPSTGQLIRADANVHEPGKMLSVKAGYTDKPTMAAVN